LYWELQRIRVNTVHNWLRYRPRHPGYGNPFARIHVDPETIDRMVIEKAQRGVIDDRDGFGQLTATWTADEHLQQVSDSSIIKGMWHRFGEARPWKDTVLFAMAEYNIEEEGGYYRYTSVDDFLNIRCKYLDALADDIRTNGYRGVCHPESDKNQSARDHYRDAMDVLVLVDADGEIVLYDGRHRLGIVQVLDTVETIPVNVVARHPDWQEIRDSVATGGLDAVPESLHGHPDL